MGHLFDVSFHNFLSQWTSRMHGLGGKKKFVYSCFSFLLFYTVCFRFSFFINHLNGQMD